jgi:hypothetical protein
MFDLIRSLSDTLELLNNSTQNKNPGSQAPPNQLNRVLSRTKICRDELMECIKEIRECQINSQSYICQLSAEQAKTKKLAYQSLVANLK